GHGDGLVRVGERRDDDPLARGDEGALAGRGSAAEPDAAAVEQPPDLRPRQAQPLAEHDLEPPPAPGAGDLEARLFVRQARSLRGGRPTGTRCCPAPPAVADDRLMRDEHGIPLATLTTIRVNGPAARLVTATSEEEIVAAVRAADDAGEPLLILAG